MKVNVIVGAALIGMGYLTSRSGQEGETMVVYNNAHRPETSAEEVGSEYTALLGIVLAVAGVMIIFKDKFMR